MKSPLLEPATSASPTLFYWHSTTKSWLFTSAILEDRTIDVFNHGKMQRDFTYIDDIAEGTLRVLDRIAPFKVYNIGNHTPIELMKFIQTIENALGQEAKKNYLPMQNGDVVATYADVSALNSDTGFEPKTELSKGISRWADWYKNYTK